MDSKISHLDDYKDLADEYEKQLNAINVDSNTRITDDSVANLALHVEQLEQEMEIIAANLTNCQGGHLDFADSTVKYVTLLDRGIGMANKIIASLNLVDACYADVNRARTAKGLGQVQKPMIIGVSSAGDYQQYFVDLYTAKRDAAKADMKKPTAPDVVDNLSLEVTALNNEVEISDKALRECKQQLKALQTPNPTQAGSGQ